MVGLGGLEPPTSPLSGVCSSQLSYRPEQTDRWIVLWIKQYVWVLSRAGNGLKGGDPAAGSPTATLLRLHPSH